MRTSDTDVSERVISDALAGAIEAVEEAQRQLRKVGATGMADDLNRALGTVTDLREWSVEHPGWTADDYDDGSDR